MKTAVLVIAVLLLSACGSKLDGTYSDSTGMVSYTFRSNGTVLISAEGTEVELKYEIDGDKIKIPMGTPQDSRDVVWTMLKDGSIQMLKNGSQIQGPGGLKLTKQKK